METLTITPRQLKSNLLDCLNADVVPMIWGPPGIAKSAVVEQTATQTNRTLFDIRSNIKESPDFTGYLCLTECRPGQPPKMTAPADLPPMDLAAPSLLFLDEINGASRDVQGALFQLVQDRRLNSYRLPDDCRIVCAGNRTVDRGVANAMPTPLKNKMVHLNVEPDVDQWVEDYAIPQGVHPVVIAWHGFKKASNVQTLMIFDPKSDDPAFASPRSWTALSKIMHQNANPSTALVCGTIGAGIGIEFSGFAKVAAEMPPADLIWLNPTAAPIPQEVSAVYAVAGMIAASVTIPTMPQFVQYITRFPSQEFSVFAMDCATRRAPELAHSPAFVSWAKEHAYILGLTN